MSGNRPKKSTRITVSLTEEVYGELTALASMNDVSIAWLTRYAINDFLKRQSKGRPQIALSFSAGDYAKAQSGGTSFGDWDPHDD